VKFTILRRLKQSELGMFHEYRRQGRERAKQRAINFDGDVVDRVFPAFRDHQQIPIECRRMETAVEVRTVHSWLRRQHKNWRLEGDCPRTHYYDFLDPGVLFAMVIDAGTTPAKASWVVIPKGHPALEAIVNHGESERLRASGMIALHDNEGRFSQSVLGKHYPLLFDHVEAATTMPSSVHSDEVAPNPLGLFNILARAGHSLPSAVADLVDNSLSHKASVIDITFPNPNESGRWMCIRDDGEGMTPEGLRDAMRIGHQRTYAEADLGKYGYGLKGAAWSQADRLTVVSKAVGGPAKTLTWDKEHLARTQRWALLEEAVAAPQDAYVSLGASGTAVLLTQMRPPLDPPKSKGVEPYAQEVAAIRDHLELVFHRYLDGKVPGRELVTIRLNGTPLRPNDPMGHPLTKPFDPRSIELFPTADSSNRAVLRVTAFITPNEAEFEDFHRDLQPEQRRVERERLSLGGRANDSQGLYFYRLNRLIKWGGWEDLFAKDEHTKLLRVAVDFDRQSDDALQVDISKQLIRLPVRVSDELKEIIKNPRAEARRRYDKKVSPPSAKPRESTTASPPAGPPGGTAGRGFPGGGGPTAPAAPTNGTSGGAAPVIGAGVPSAGPSSTSGGATSASSGSPTPAGLATTPKASPPSPTGRKDKSPIRIVQTGTDPWERKLAFTGEQVEIGPALPQLQMLAQVIEKDAAAGSALSEFLRVLEQVGAVELLRGKTDGT
jgi:hypothetical protein